MGTLRMSIKERQRAQWLSRVEEGLVSLRAAAEKMKVSYRQAKRLKRRYEKKKDQGLVHGLRGRASNHHGEDEARERAIALYREKYEDFGPTLAAEQMQKRDDVEVEGAKLRRWLLAAGLWERRRKRSAHRQWRAREAHWGEMVQMDGSEHDWLEGRGPRCVLMVMIDDATNRTQARFFSAETTVAAMQMFQDYVECQGLPQSLYVDLDSIYQVNRDATADEVLADTGALTQFGRAMKELGVEIINAYSPQAKGRVERRHGVFQDRLVKELRLEGIGDQEAANAYLKKTFLPDLNARFTVAPVKPGNWHRRVPRDVKLEEVLSFQEPRVVQNDWTVRWRNRWLQVSRDEQRLSLARQKVLVRELLDGTLQLVFRRRLLKWTELLDRPGKPPVTKPAKPKAKKSHRAWKPPADHPWRRNRQATASAQSPKGEPAPS